MIIVVPFHGGLNGAVFEQVTCHRTGAPGDDDWEAREPYVIKG